MLSKILDSLEVSKELRRHIWISKNIQFVFETMGTSAFLINWFKYTEFTPDIEKVYKVSNYINLNNIYNFSILCFYTERFGIPNNSKWFKQSVIAIATGSDLNLDVNNLVFYKRFLARDRKIINRTRLINAAYTITRDLKSKASVYNKILEQGLITRIGQEDFRFSSTEIRKAIKSINQAELNKYKVELIQSQLTSSY
jgi:hypothetical protein